MAVLKKGCLARFDGLEGIVPCKVIRIWDEPGIVCSHRRVEIEFTVNCPHMTANWRKGERTITSPTRVVPVEAVRRTKFSHVFGSYTVEVDTEPKSAE